MTFVLKPVFALLAIVCACGPAKRDVGGDDGVEVDAKPIDATCNTSISGKVFAPNGTLPLYNVIVYVPASDPPPFPAGVQCATCTEIPGGALAKAVSDATGKFKLENVPTGVGLPIIVTTGKWRRKLTIPPVTPCIDNVIPDGMFRLPRNRTEGELPRIAMVTGGCDPLACILSKLGIDATEFGTDSNGPTPVVFYSGSGGTSPGTPQSVTTLWGNLDEMKKFDVIINSCECSEHNENKTSPDLLRQYADLGGRVFGSHFHYTWTKNLIPAWQSRANWAAGSSGTPDLVDTTHPGGQALAQWLVAVGASSINGQISLDSKIPNASTVHPTTTRWLYSSGAAPATTHYLSFNTPVGVAPANQCGKVVYAGMHVASGSVGTTFPAACSTTFAPDEKALVFLLFDLGACVDIIL